MVSLDDLERIAEIEFADIVESTLRIGVKLRVLLVDDSFIDIWLSQKLENRYGFHWEQMKTGLSFRYDNFPNTQWADIPTYPFHFHDGSQNNVVESSLFEPDVSEGFRGFMAWTREHLTR